MGINVELYESIFTQFGMNQYAWSDIEKFLHPNEIAEIKRLFENPESAIYRAFRKGYDSIKLQIDSAINQDATVGNKEAIKMLQKIQKDRQMQEFKDMFFNL